MLTLLGAGIGQGQGYRVLGARSVNMAYFAGHVPLALDAVRCLHAWATDHTTMGPPHVSALRLHVHFLPLHAALFGLLGAEVSSTLVTGAAACGSLTA